jgi:hypothetical protein
MCGDHRQEGGFLLSTGAIKTGTARPGGVVAARRPAVSLPGFRVECVGGRGDRRHRLYQILLQMFGRELFQVNVMRTHPTC